MSAATKLDPTTAERMGYDGIVAAQTIDAGNLRVELCLIAPGHIANDQYSLAIHWDCDPNKPTAGSSSMEEVGRTEEDATAVFVAKLDEIRAELGLPTYNTGPGR